MLKFEYRGLDVVDQIASVPVAYDEQQRVLHIKDESYVVWPDYKGEQVYALSDGFYQMVSTLKKQYLFKVYVEYAIEQWIRQFTFYFYRSGVVLMFKGNDFVEKIPINSINDEDLLVFSEWLS